MKPFFQLHFWFLSFSLPQFYFFYWHFFSHLSSLLRLSYRYLFSHLSSLPHFFPSFLPLLSPNFFALLFATISSHPLYKGHIIVFLPHCFDFDFDFEFIRYCISEPTQLRPALRSSSNLDGLFSIIFEVSVIVLLYDQFKVVNFVSRFVIVSELFMTVSHLSLLSSA